MVFETINSFLMYFKIIIMILLQKKYWQLKICILNWTNCGIMLQVFISYKLLWTCVNSVRIGTSIDKIEEHRFFAKKLQKQLLVHKFGIPEFKGIIIWHVDHWCPITSLLMVICIQWIFDSDIQYVWRVNYELRGRKFQYRTDIWNCFPCTMCGIYQQNPHLALHSYHEEHGTRNLKLLALVVAFTKGSKIRIDGK